jgi:hypothetical protein
MTLVLMIRYPYDMYDNYAIVIKKKKKDFDIYIIYFFYGNRNVITYLDYRQKRIPYQR